MNRRTRRLSQPRPRPTRTWLAGAGPIGGSVAGAAASTPAAWAR